MKPPSWLLLVAAAVAAAAVVVFVFVAVLVLFVLLRGGLLPGLALIVNIHGSVLSPPVDESPLKE